MNETTIMDQIREYNQNCEDLSINMSGLRYLHFNPEDKEADLKYTDLLSGTMSLIPTFYAEGQLLTRLGIPAPYFRKCPGHLKSSNFNYWVTTLTDKPLLLRLRRQENKVIARAFLTESYTCKDDIEVFPVILHTLEGYGDKEYSVFQKDDTLTVMRMLFNSLKAEAEGYSFTSGILVNNSEVGAAALRVQPILRLEDRNHSNFWLADLSKEGVTRFIHKGQELNHQNLVTAINQARDIAQVGIARAIQQSKEKCINTFSKEIEDFVKSRSTVPNAVIDIVSEQWGNKQETTKLEVAVAILEAVKHLPKIEEALSRQLEIERQVGNYLDLFVHTEKRLGQLIAQELF